MPGFRRRRPHVVGMGTTVACRFTPCFFTPVEAGRRVSTLAKIPSLARLYLVGEGHDAVVLLLIELLCLVAKVVIPRTPHRLVDVTVRRGVQDLGKAHPVHHPSHIIPSIKHQCDGPGQRRGG